MDFYCCDKTPWQKQFGNKKVSFSLQSVTEIGNGNQGRNLEEDTETEAEEELYLITYSS